MVVTGGSVECHLKVGLEVTRGVFGIARGERRKGLGVRDVAGFGVVFQAAVVQELEMEGAAKGPMFGVGRMKEGGERVGGEVGGYGSMAKGGVGAVGLGGKRVEGKVDKGSVVVSKIVAGSGDVMGGGEEEVRGSGGWEEGGE